MVRAVDGGVGGPGAGGEDVDEEQGESCEGEEQGESGEGESLDVTVALSECGAQLKLTFIYPSSQTRVSVCERERESVCVCVKLLTFIYPNSQTRLEDHVISLLSTSQDPKP